MHIKGIFIKAHQASRNYMKFDYWMSTFVDTKHSSVAHYSS